MAKQSSKSRCDLYLSFRFIVTPSFLSASIFLCKVTAWVIVSSTALLTGAGFNNNFPRMDGAARA